MTHTIGPKAWVDGNVAGYGMRFPVGTVLVDPAIVSDQRQAELLLEGTESVGKEFPGRLVKIGSASQRIRALPRAFMSFRVEPAVELNVAQPNVHIPELISHLEKRADVSESLPE